MYIVLLAYRNIVYVIYKNLKIRIAMRSFAINNKCKQLFTKTNYCKNILKIFQKVVDKQEKSVVIYNHRLREKHLILILEANEMKTYKGMTRSQITEKIIDARIAECKTNNEKKFSDGLPRMNENREFWGKYLSTLPLVSKKYPAFSLVGMYEAYYA